MSSKSCFTVTEQDGTVVFGTFIVSDKKTSPALMIYVQVPGGVTFITLPWTKGFIFVKNRQPPYNDPA